MIIIEEHTIWIQLRKRTGKKAEFATVKTRSSKLQTHWQLRVEEKLNVFPMFNSLLSFKIAQQKKNWKIHYIVILIRASLVYLYKENVNHYLAFLYGVDVFCDL